MARQILREITPRTDSQSALVDSERRLASEVARARTLQAISTRLISESSQDSLFSQVLDAAMELMSSDCSSVQMLASDGHSLKLLGSRNFHPDSAAFWDVVTLGSQCTCGQAMRTGERVLVSDVESDSAMRGTSDLEEYRRSGIRAVQSTPLQSRTGKPLGMLSTHWRRAHTPTDDEFRLFDVLARQAADLIERSQVEESLRESEERFRLIANAVPVTIWMTGTDGRCVFVNQRWLDFTGQALETALGQGWIEAIHPDDAASCLETCASAAKERKPFQMENRIRRHDGEYRWMLERGEPRYAPDGSFAGYIGSCMDVTDRKLAEESLSRVGQRLIEAQEEERARVARELHDDVNQRLALLSMRLATVQDTQGVSPDARRKIEETCDDCARLVEDVQALSHRLHPARLDYLGIAEASAAMCRERSAQHSVTIVFHAEGVPDRLSQRASLCLYRVLQEALQNAIKHSGSTKVDVTLRGESEQIELRVDDFGSGFDIAGTAWRGLGLTSMSERLKAVDGQLVIDSQPKRGTSIRARVPLIASV